MVKFLILSVILSIPGQKSDYSIRTLKEIDMNIMPVIDHSLRLWKNPITPVNCGNCVGVGRILDYDSGYVYFNSNERVITWGSNINCCIERVTNEDYLSFSNDHLK